MVRLVSEFGQYHEIRKTNFCFFVAFMYAIEGNQKTGTGKKRKQIQHFRLVEFHIFNFVHQVYLPWNLIALKTQKLNMYQIAFFLDLYQLIIITKLQRRRMLGKQRRQSAQMCSSLWAPPVILGLQPQSTTQRLSIGSNAPAVADLIEENSSFCASQKNGTMI